MVGATNDMQCDAMSTWRRAAHSLPHQRNNQIAQSYTAARRHLARGPYVLSYTWRIDRDDMMCDDSACSLNLLRGSTGRPCGTRE